MTVDPTPTAADVSTAISYVLDALYPDPVFPTLIEETVPSPEITEVPPAEISGWKPRPLSVIPTETITPPTGKLELLTSYETEVAVPANVIELIPELSVIV